MTYFQIKVFSNAKVKSLVYWTLFTNGKILGFYTDISHKLVCITAQMLQMELDYKPKPVHKILDNVIFNLLLDRMQNKINFNFTPTLTVHAEKGRVEPNVMT